MKKLSYCIKIEKTVDKLKVELAVAKALTEFSEENFKSDEFTRLYTGLPNIGMFKTTFEHVHKTLPAERSTKLTPFQEFVCTMVKLSVNTPIEDLGYRFRVSTSTVSRILLKWLRQMDIRLKDLINWRIVMYFRRLCLCASRNHLERRLL